MDPREVEMIAIINGLPVPDEVLKGIEQLETSTTSTLILGDAPVTGVEELEPQEDDVILKPGTVIKPDVDIEDARKLAERLYGIVAKDIKELISYDDRNFFIQPDSIIKNPIIANQCSHGYILKIHNSLDSKKIGFTDAQTQLMLFLGQQNVKCPRPVMNINGKYFSLENLSGESPNCVRLLEYVPGKIFHQVPTKTSHLYYQAGEFVGRLDNALKNFKHDAYKRHRSLWQLSSVSKISDFIYALRDESKQEIVEQVLEQFDKHVMQHLDTFAKGIIHGDFNEQNILVQSVLGKPEEFKINAVIDFGDTSLSCYVFELAIAMTYMMLQGGDLSIGGLVLAGYSMVRTVPDHEKRVLKLCVAARLCQSLVLGAYSHAQDPGNDYVLTTQAAGWELLTKLWEEPEEKLSELWNHTADTYLTQSTK